MYSKLAVHELFSVIVMRAPEPCVPRQALLKPSSEFRGSSHDASRSFELLFAIDWHAHG